MSSLFRGTAAGLTFLLTFNMGISVVDVNAVENTVVERDLEKERKSEVQQNITEDETEKMIVNDEKSQENENNTDKKDIEVPKVDEIVPEADKVEGQIGESEDLVDAVKQDELKLFIDRPTTSAVLEEGKKLYIEGWAISKLGIKEVIVSVNDKKVGQAEYGVARNDVQAAFPTFKDPRDSGFKLSVDSKFLVKGKNDIKIEGISESGQKIAKNIQIEVKEMVSAGPAKLVVDTPKFGAILTQNFEVSGWTLQSSGTKQVKIFINDKHIADAHTGITRPDVANIFGEYPNADKSGFKILIGFNRLIAGENKITVESVGNDGEVKSQTINVVVNKLKPLLMIDGPTMNSSYNTDAKVDVKGWSLNQSGVEAVKVYVDGRYIGNATKGLERMDVYKSFNKYENKNSGYSFNLDLAKFSGKSKITIKVEAIGKDNDIVSKETIINLKKNEVVEPEVPDIEEPSLPENDIPSYVIDPKLTFNFGLEGPSANKPEMLVLHHAAGGSSIYNVHQYHLSKGWAGIGYHYYIHTDGKVYSGRKENWKGAHTGNSYNSKSLGISVQGNYEVSNMPKAQEDAIVKLCQDLIEKYRFSDIRKHSDVSATSCPGDMYPFDRIKARILSKYIYGVYNTDL